MNTTGSDAVYSALALGVAQPTSNNPTGTENLDNLRVVS